MTTNQQEGEGVSKEKVTLVYENRQLKITIGDKELPLNSIIDPAEIILSANEPPTLRFELSIDTMSMDDIEAIGKYVSFDDLKDD